MLRVSIPYIFEVVFIRYKDDGRGKSVPVAKVYTLKEHNIRNDQIDKDALWAIKRIQQSGAEAYIVGGAVRDLMLGRHPKDFDVATSLSPRQVQRMFWNSRIIGRRFRIVHLFFGSKIIEVTTFRSDEENFEDGRNNVYGSIEQDAKRRDFSVNSFYYNPINSQLLDFNDAMEDFKRREIRSLIPLSYSFSEDPVRMIRALKYQVTTGFTLRKDVKKAIKKNAGNIETCSISRLTEEVSKILSTGFAHDIFISLDKYGLLTYILPVFSMYLGYDSIRSALSLLDEQVRRGQESGSPITKDEQIYIMLKPLIVLENPEDTMPDELFKEAFRQAKILISPMTPPNYEIEKAIDRILEDNGIKRARRRKSAEARAMRKKPNNMGRKSAANEELSSGVKKSRRKKRKKIAPESFPKNLAEGHDL